MTSAFAGEVEPQYASVMNSNPISTWPVNSPSRWNILLDAVLVGSKTVSVSSTVNGAPAGKAVVLLDSGTSYTSVFPFAKMPLSLIAADNSYAPEAVCNAIYGGVPGAAFDASLGQWTVPCSAEIDLALQFG